MAGVVTEVETQAWEMRGGCVSAIAEVTAVVITVSAHATEGNPVAAGLAEEFSWDVSVVPKRKLLERRGPWRFFIGPGSTISAGRGLE